MKNKTLLLLVILISLIFFLKACKETAVKSEKNENNINLEVETKGEDNQIKLATDKNNATQGKIANPLTPNEEIEFGEIYTDTVHFITFDDNTDYWYFLAKKNNDTIQIIYHSDIQMNELVTGDEIEIDWEMKRLQEAGDEDIMYIKPYLVAFRKMNSAKLIDKKVKVLWRANVYDEDLKQDMNTIALNKDYQEHIAQQERAAIGYVATFIGNECEWEGKPNKIRGNLKCVLLSYLDLGYQCSDKHLRFLNTSFSKDTVAIKKLKICRTMPNTATIQSTFDEILLETNTQDQTIVIKYKVTVLNMRESSVSSYSKIDRFKYDEDQIKLFSSEKMEHSESSKATDNKQRSFVISCGSGCAMTYSERKIVSNSTAREVTFGVEMYINEKLSDEYLQTYVYTCDTSSQGAQIHLKGDIDYKIEDEHPQIKEKLTSYIKQLCSY